LRDGRRGKFKKALPKASVCKSCLRFKKLSDLDEAALAKLIRAGAQPPAPQAK
jgi:hypothetical protein